MHPDISGSWHCIGGCTHDGGVGCSEFKNDTEETLSVMVTSHMMM